MCPASDVEELTRLVPGGVGVVAQKGEGLAAGLTSVFAHFASGQRRVIAFNSDSPHLPASVLENAFQALAAHDVVVGPTHDGGYYLVGAKATHPTLFEGDGMGTNECARGLAGARSGPRLSVGFTDPFYDIDVAGRPDSARRGTPDRSDEGATNSDLARTVGTRGGAVANGRGRPVKLTPSRRLYVLGVIILAALAICSRNFSSMGAPSFIIPLAVAGIAYLFAVREFFSTATFPKHVIVVGLVLAAVWHLLFLMKPPGPDDDIHRYVWDGRVQRLGYNPYIVVPNDPALARLHTPETRTLNHPDLPSPYPAGAELFFRAVTAIHESVFALKIAFVLCDLAIVFVLLDVLRGSGQGAHWVSGLCLESTAGNRGGGQRSHRHCRRTAAVGVVRRAGAPLACGGGGDICAGCCREVSSDCTAATLLEAGSCARRRAGGSRVRTPLHTISRPRADSRSARSAPTSQSFRFNDPVFATLERVAAPQLVVGLAVLVGFLTAIWLRKSPRQALRTHLPGRWQHRFYVHRSYIRGTCSGCCRSCGRPRRCRSSSGR